MCTVKFVKNVGENHQSSMNLRDFRRGTVEKNFSGHGAEEKHATRFKLIPKKLLQIENPSNGVLKITLLIMKQSSLMFSIVSHASLLIHFLMFALSPLLFRFHTFHLFRCCRCWIELQVYYLYGCQY